MNKKLEELFNLPTKEQENLEVTEQLPMIQDTLTNVEKIEKALPQVRGLDASDQEIDELADLAKNTYKDLMDLGMQTESRFSSEIFNVAGTMLGHAITAKTAKVQKKLKMIELQLKKAVLDQKISAQERDVDSIPNAVPGDSGRTILDRNELLKSVIKKNQDQ